MKDCQRCDGAGLVWVALASPSLRNRVPGGRIVATCSDCNGKGKR